MIDLTSYISSAVEAGNLPPFACPICLEPILGSSGLKAEVNGAAVLCHDNCLVDCANLQDAEKAGEPRDKLLFICLQGRFRSRTAATYFKNRYDTAFAGVESGALAPLTNEQIQWADRIIVMDWEIRKLMKKKHNAAMHGRGDDIMALNIPDVYDFMDGKLCVALEKMEVFSDGFKQD